MARRTGGIGVKVGPVFAWRGGDGPGVGGLIGLLMGIAIAVALVLLLLPLALAWYSSWAFSRWSPGGRPPARSRAVEALLLVSGCLAIPLALFVAWTVWRGALT
jgi:hypothetical protein